MSRSNRSFDIRAAQRTSLVVGVVGIAVSVVGFFVDSKAFFSGWLMGWFYWLSIAMGCLGFFMIYRLSGGLWGKSLERIFLAAARTFELLLVLALPLIAGLHVLYAWSVPALVGADPILRHKEFYLNIPFWGLRALFYFAIWIGLSWVLTRVRVELLRLWSAGGLVLLFITGAFSSVDWIMSLEPLWYSTVYGLIILTGQGLSAYAFAMVLSHSLRKNFPAWNPPSTHKVLKDQGSIQLTACILWTYVAFVQWLIIWIGNVPETVTWYISRAQGLWSAMAWGIFIGQFFIPFQLLIFQAFKQSTRNLAGLGIFLMLVHAMDVYWLIGPALYPEKVPLNGFALSSWIGVGGVWFAFFFYRLQTLKPVSVESTYTPLLGELLHG